MLKPEAKKIAVKIASQIILKIAAQIADTGVRTGALKYRRTRNPSDDIEIDRTVECYIEQAEGDIRDHLVTSVRIPERRAFVLMLDRSYSMRGVKIVRAAITAAAVAIRFRQDYGVISFSSQAQTLKGLKSRLGPETLIEKIFHLELKGETDIAAALQAALYEMAGYPVKVGLLLTDGNWNRGQDPLQMAPLYDALHVICFPPARPHVIEQLAQAGKGTFAFVEDEQGIVRALRQSLG